MSTSALSNLPAHRQAAVKKAAEGCWEGTDKLIAVLVEESRHKGAWRASRAAVLRSLDPFDGVHMTPAEFSTWRKQARALAKITGRDETPVQDLGMHPKRFAELGSQERFRNRNMRVSRDEAMACAHYLTGLPKPCTVEELPAWFWPRFGSFATVAPFLSLDARTVAARINGYMIVNDERRIVTPDGSFLRALDWLWRFGPVHPYGERHSVPLWPGQAALPL